MSLEAKIEALTASINTLIGVMQNTTVSVPVVTAPPAPVAPVAAPPVPAPVAQVEMPAPPAFTAPAAAPAVQMPAPPSFIAPAAAPAAAPTAPFTDAAGLTAYVVAAYQTLGAEKGMQIQGILTQLGVGNINEVQPAQYSALYAAVEALKAA